MVVEGDSVSNDSCGGHLSVETMLVYLLDLQRPDDLSHYPVLLWAVRGDGFLLRAIATHQSCLVATGEHGRGGSANSQTEC